MEALEKTSLVLGDKEMSEEDKKLQKHLVDEMMKVYETNPDVMLYMQSLMENYDKLEQENKQLKEKIDKAIDFLHNNTMIGHCKEHYELLEILGDKENE